MQIYEINVLETFGSKIGAKQVPKLILKMYLTFFLGAKLAKILQKILDVKIKLTKTIYYYCYISSSL